MQRVILHLFFVICLPDFVTKVDFDWAIEEKAKKKKQDSTKVKFFTYDKGERVQCMYFGPYDDKSETISAMIEYAEKRDQTIDITDTLSPRDLFVQSSRDGNQGPKDRGVLSDKKSLITSNSIRQTSQDLRGIGIC